ncbi:type III effector [Pseudomonas amygdali pv. eriobotryae]|nr:type III effector [Pseudomonas amygdali pv. eriobotryae]
MHRPITAGHTTSRLILDQLKQISRTPSESSVQSALSQQASMSSPVLERSKSAPALLTAAQRTMLAQVGACNSHLTSDENMAINELRLHKPRLPKDTWFFTDPNKDPDDVVTYTLGKQLQAEGFVHITDVVATLGDAEVRSQRAEMAKGVFNKLGLHDVHVSRGRDYAMNSLQSKEHAKFLLEGHALRAGPGEIHRDSLQDMSRRLARAPHGVSIVVIAGMSDINALITTYPDMVRERVDDITIMGGVEPLKDADGFVQPDARAYNNATDMDAARSLYRKAQELGIPLRIVTKEAAYKTAVSPSFYEGIAGSGHPVGHYLRDVQKSALKGLWEGIQAGLLPGLDDSWFFRTFMPNAQIEAAQLDKNKESSFEDIWPKVTKLNLYDPLTLLASVPGAAKLLFKPKAIHTEGFGVVEQVGPDDVTHPEKARLLMSALAKSALAQSTVAPD